MRINLPMPEEDDGPQGLEAWLDAMRRVDRHLAKGRRALRRFGLEPPIKVTLHLLDPGVP